MFTLAIFCVTTSNLPWFMDLTFQVPKKYSLQHWTLLPSPVTSSTASCFCFGSVSSFFLVIVNFYITNILCYMSWKAFVIWRPIFPGISAKFLVSLPYIPLLLDKFQFIIFLREIYSVWSDHYRVNLEFCALFLYFRFLFIHLRSQQLFL